MLDILLQILAGSRLFNGLSTFAMQVGSRYMLAEIPGNVEKSFNKPFFRRLFIFFVFFLAFRDIKWAILATLLFILAFNYLLNEKSKIYIGNLLGLESEKKVEPQKIITVADLENAKTIIQTYNQSLENQKIKFK